MDCGKAQAAMSNYPQMCECPRYISVVTRPPVSICMYLCMYKTHVLLKMKGRCPSLQIIGARGQNMGTLPKSSG